MFSRAPNLLLVLLSRMVGWNELCNPAWCLTFTNILYVSIPLCGINWGLQCRKFNGRWSYPSCLFLPPRIIWGDPHTDWNENYGIIVNDYLSLLLLIILLWDQLGDEEYQLLWLEWQLEEWRLSHLLMAMVRSSVKWIIAIDILI